MDRLTPSKPLIVEGNLVQTQKRWKQDFKSQSDSNRIKKPDQVKSSLLLHCIGEKGREIYNNFAFDNEENTLVYDKLI